MPNVSNDLSQKLYATMEKHKEVLQREMIHCLYVLKCLHVITLKQLTESRISGWETQLLTRFSRFYSCISAGTQFN